VIADRLLAAQPELGVRQVGVLLDEPAQVVFDRTLVLRGRGDDARVDDRAFVVQLVAVPEQPSWRFGGTEADGGSRLELDVRPTTMLRNGFRDGGIRPAAAAASRASWLSCPPLRLKRAIGPVR
jgi:hypothetical protein